MLMTSERRPAIRTLRGWAIDVLQNAGAIRECEQHGWMQDRADPHAWERAIDIARENPPAGVSPDAAAAEVRYVLNSIGEVESVSMSRGRSIGLDAAAASPGKHVVADLTPNRPRRSGNDGWVTPLG